MRPKVTIGICTKNAEKSIKNTLESVVQQGFPHELMEIIFVDGKSEDRTLEIATEILSKSDIKIKLMSENKGLGVARELIVESARSDYIIWVDSDMILPRDYVEKQVEFMETHEEVGIASGSHGILPNANLVAALEDVAYIAVDSKFKGYSSCVQGRLPSTAGAIFRVEAIRGAGGFDSSVTGVGEDIEAAYRVRKKGWELYRGTEATFFEERKGSWKELWDHYVWYGRGAYRLISKNPKVINPYGLMPIAGLLLGVQYSTIAYRLMHNKRVFLLPFHYFFKRCAWFYGFARAK